MSSTTDPHSNTERDQKPAGLTRRLAALVYDSLLLLAVLFLATAVALAASFGKLHYSGWPFRVYLVLVVYLFFGWFWTHGGQTLGMQTWKIRVENPDGSAIGWRQAAIRLFLGLVTLGIGQLWTLIDAQKRSLYDLASSSRVVRTGEHRRSSRN